MLTDSSRVTRSAGSAVAAAGRPPGHSPGSGSGSGIHSPTYRSRRARAEPSMSRQMRLATVVSQAPGDAMASCSWRDSAPAQELVKLRASQINGCAVCTDMHAKDAAHAGETPVRLALVAAWRDAKVFTDAERAALELTEQGTRIADAAGGVTDEAWANAAKYYDTEQLAALVCTIASINAYNRFNVILKNQGGDYQPGQWG